MILIAIPERDFDPTECSIPWKVLTDAYCFAASFLEVLEGVKNPHD